MNSVRIRACFNNIAVSWSRHPGRGINSAWTHRSILHQTRCQSFSQSAARTGIAAPEIDFSTNEQIRDVSLLERVRVIPASPSYFTAKPDFTDSFLSLQNIYRKYQTLPTVQPGHAPRVSWKSLAQYRLLVGEPVKAAKYHKVLQILGRLNQIHPSLMPEEVRREIDSYKRLLNAHENMPRERTGDGFGRAIGVGRRKSSSARVWLVEGDGQVLVNGKSLTETFPRLHDRESALWALKATQRLDKYNVWALVSGGGLTGQAGALTLGVAKALLIHEPALKPALRRAGCITRDPRRVERKKPGKVKARKMPAWVKR
ncbi:hypothetical protein L228DRAFT_247012 [Xylona heveae TC161]|uniref:Small ribosomal subunit protein uS9m n=1 Tax=Xylona heveae (strain CBS 132557 / TC161) TaxID=1328760 RepID=A0A165GVR1_XYLHT|nr:hypothetical protein L228DRAFT_247012 [Xylona heveae TC161]KZF22657.1 hypothetical protein L228DRAFT_247012 [Xylona heveae TC161]